MAEQKFNLEELPVVQKFMDQKEKFKLDNLRELMVESLLGTISVPLTISRRGAFAIMSSAADDIVKNIVNASPELRPLANQMSAGLRQTVTKELDTMPDALLHNINDIRPVQTLGKGEMAGSKTSGRFDAQGKYPMKGDVLVALDVPYRPGTLLHEGGAHSRLLFPLDKPTGVMGTERELAQTTFQTSELIHSYLGVPRYKTAMEKMAYDLADRWALGNRAKFNYEQAYMDSLKKALFESAPDLQRLEKAVPAAKDLYQAVLQALQP